MTAHLNHALGNPMILFLMLLLVQDSDEYQDEWITVAPPRIGARIKMPSRPVFSENAIQPVHDQPEIVLRTRSMDLPGGKSTLTFEYHDEHEMPRGRRQVDAVLNGAITGAIALVNGELVTQSDVFKKNYKGSDFVYKCEVEDAKLQKVHKLTVRSQVILVEKRLYSMNYIAEADAYDDKIASRFFKSFELVKSPGDAPPKPRAGRARQLSESK